MERTATLFGIALLAFATSASAQGYFSFGEIPGVRAEPTVEIDLNPALLGFVNEAAKGANTEAANALAGVTNVRVYVYEGIGDDLAAVLKFVDDTSAKLEREGWHPAVRVREDGEQVRIYMKPAAENSSTVPGTLAGLTVMVTDSGSSDEAVFINIAGAIQPAQFGKIAGAIGMNGMLNGVPGVGALTPPDKTGQ